MKQLLFSTQHDWSGLISRLTLALIMFPHGAQKLLGWFGGYGFTATIDFLTRSMRLPWIVALIIILLEFIGPIGLMLGFMSKLWAFGLMIIMIGAICTTNFKNGFFMNWFGTQAGEGYEYHLLVLGICLVILFAGSGKYSLDTFFQK